MDRNKMEITIENLPKILEYNGFIKISEGEFYCEYKKSNRYVTLHLNKFICIESKSFVRYEELEYEEGKELFINKLYAHQIELVIPFVNPDNLWEWTLQNGWTKVQEEERSEEIQCLQNHNAEFRIIIDEEYDGLLAMIDGVSFKVKHIQSDMTLEINPSFSLTLQINLLNAFINSFDEKELI